MGDEGAKRALITGGSLGIGAACVRLFREKGIDTLFTYFRHSDEADAIRRETGAAAVQADLTLREGWDRVVRAVMDRPGGIDILVHNAGIWNDGAMGGLSHDVWRTLMAINLDAVGYITNALVPEMKRDGGSIVFVSSTAARRGEAYHGHYAASKGALISFARSLAVELGPCGIRSNVVAPGWVDTPMSAGALSRPGRREGIPATIPLGRIATAAASAHPSYFLVPGAARQHNGAGRDVNGGARLVGG